MMYLIAAILGAVLFSFAAYAFRLLPNKWVCDYDEQPTEIHMAANRKLSPIYIIIFAIIGSVCTILALRTFNSSLPAAFLCAAVFAVLTLSAICDAKYQILPDELIIVAAVLSIILWITGTAPQLYPHWYTPLIGAVIGFFAMWLFMFLASKLYKTEAMGFGDVKLMAVVGLLCGAQGLAAAALFAVLSAAVIFAVLIILKKQSSHDVFPFGPFIVAGAIFCICLRPEWTMLVQWYIGLF